MPVIFLSSSNVLSNQANSYSSETNDFLAKVVVKSELIAGVQNQMKIMQADLRMSALLEFSRGMETCKDSRAVFELVFKTIENNTYFIHISGLAHSMAFLYFPLIVGLNIYCITRMLDKEFRPGKLSVTLAVLGLLLGLVGLVLLLLVRVLKVLN